MMIVPNGGYFQVGKDSEFPFCITDKTIWFFTVDSQNNVTGYTPSKTNKQLLIDILSSDATVTLFGVWTGKYSTSIFVLDSKVSIKKLKEVT